MNSDDKTLCVFIIAIAISITMVFIAGFGSHTIIKYAETKYKVCPNCGKVITNE